MECEMCGGPIRGRPSRIRIEGTVMSTCKGCARFGTEITEEPERKRAPAFGSRGSRPGTSRKEVEGPEPVEDYGARIRRAREQKGLTQEELGNLMNERASVIARLESQKMGMTAKMARKLENVLGAILFEKAE